MHYRRLASLLFGAWLGISIFMALVATQNFGSVDRLLANPAPQAAQQIQASGHDQARAFLRYLVSEQNRWYFEHWETAQLVLGIVLFLVILFATAEDKVVLLLAALMFAAVVVQKFFLTPNITALGRVIDFVPAGAPSAERTRFWMFHTSYSVTELAKWTIGIIAVGKFLVRSRGSRRSRDEVDLVDEADHGHVDR